jgi:hypothetical protein
MTLFRVLDRLLPASGDAMRKILVVDDDALICDLVVDFLGEWVDAEVDFARMAGWARGNCNRVASTWP